MNESKGYYICHPSTWAVKNKDGKRVYDSTKKGNAEKIAKALNEGTLTEVTLDAYLCGLTDIKLD